MVGQEHFRIGSDRIGSDRLKFFYQLCTPDSASSQSEGHRYDVTYSERKLEGIELIEENRDNIVQVALEESDWGLMGPPPGHWDVVSSLQYISKVYYLIVP